MKRLDYSLRNLKYSYIGNIAVLILQFISRTIFIQYVGNTYLGLESVFSNILGVLSFAELGIGTSINFSMYGPVARNETRKIRALLQLYKKCYFYISFIVLAMGLIMVPFLPLFAKTDGLNYYYLVYFIYLFNTVTSYFVSYKYALPNAEQKNYIFTNINTITRVVLISLQIMVLYTTKSFLWYAIIGLLINLFQKILSNLYLNKKYPLFRTLSKEDYLDEKELTSIKKNVKGLIFHRIGEMSVYQTDNLIISGILGVAMAGIISNYNLIINSVSTFTSLILNSVSTSLGNMCATESAEYQFSIFKLYRFVAFWIYGFCAIALFVLINPFIELWIGEEYLISNWTVFFIVLNFYFLGFRICINNFKVAAGIFYQDRYLSLIQAIVNLIVSITLVKTIGLSGVFIGTVVQGLISNVFRTRIIYHNVFNKSSKVYFADSFKYLLVIVITTLLCKVIQLFFFLNKGIIEFIVLMILVAIIPNLVFGFCFKKSDEFARIKDIVLIRLGRK